MSSQPWNQNLLLYVVSRNLASTSLRLLFPLCAVASPGGPLTSEWIGLSVDGEMNESWRNLGFLGRCKWWTHFFPHQIDHVDVFEYLPVDSDNTGLKRRCPVLFRLCKDGDWRPSLLIRRSAWSDATEWILAEGSLLGLQGNPVSTGTTFSFLTSGVSTFFLCFWPVAGICALRNLSVC